MAELLANGEVGRKCLFRAGGRSAGISTTAEPDDLQSQDGHWGVWPSSPLRQAKSRCWDAPPAAQIMLTPPPILILSACPPVDYVDDKQGVVTRRQRRTTDGPTGLGVCWHPSEGGFVFRGAACLSVCKQTLRT